LKGEVKVSLTCSGMDRIVNCPSLRLVKGKREMKKVSVIRAFQHPDGDVVVRLKEVEGVEEAETLRGVYLAVLAVDEAKLPPDSYYLHDLVGMTVETPGGEALGKITEVMDGPANGVCVVRDGEKEILLPALKSVIRKVDLKARRMVAELPEVIDGDAAD